MTAERHMVTITTERTGQITLTPAQFDMLLMAASVGLDGYEGPGEDIADELFAIVNKAMMDHAA